MVMLAISILGLEPISHYYKNIRALINMTIWAWFTTKLFRNKFLMKLYLTDVGVRKRYIWGVVGV